ncbi:MAG TPA: hypothetical protein VLL31_01245 [Sulfurovum sp.]|nr:hypothetical protein [Sulfurovum sp.]
MNTIPNIFLFLHPAFGLFSILSAVWLFVETINANEANKKRIDIAAFNVVGWMLFAWIAGGQWYVVFYPAEKAMILKGAWPFAHSFFMEVKEHMFFIPLILALYLPIVAVRNSLHINDVARKMVMTLSLLIIVISLFIEGAGAVITQGAKISYHQACTVEVQNDAE